MARYTVAYSNLVNRLEEVKALQKLAKKHSSLFSRDVRVSNALCRSGVVLLCSHVEGYVDELVQIISERIVSKNLDKSKLPPRFYFFVSRDIILEIQQATDPSNVVEKIWALLERDNEIWLQNENLRSPLNSEIFLSNFATPMSKQIFKLMNRFGYENFGREMHSFLTSEAVIVTNMLDQVVRQRNKIAHGDTIATSTYQDLENMIDLVQKFCRVTDQLVGAWFANKRCPIR